MQVLCGMAMVQSSRLLKGMAPLKALSIPQACLCVHPWRGVALHDSQVQHKISRCIAECPSTRLHAREVPDIKEALFMESYDSRHSRHSVTSAIASTLHLDNPPLRLDSQCKYGLLARGDGNIFMRFPDTTYRCAFWVCWNSIMHYGQCMQFCDGVQAVIAAPHQQ